MVNIFRIWWENLVWLSLKFKMFKRTIFYCRLHRQTFPTVWTGAKRYTYEECRAKKFSRTGINWCRPIKICFPQYLFGGMVRLYRESGDGKEFLVYYLQPGNAWALSIICATKKKTSKVMAKAIEETKALLIPIALMDTSMRDYST